MVSRISPYRLIVLPGVILLAWPLVLRHLSWTLYRAALSLHCPVRTIVSNDP